MKCDGFVVARSFLTTMAYEFEVRIEQLKVYYYMTILLSLRFISMLLEQSFYLELVGVDRGGVICQNLSHSRVP